MSTHQPTTEASMNPEMTSGTHPADQGDAGYDKALKNRHLQMIAIGGSIGTGLFLGAGGRLAQGGPLLALAYAVCGVFAFLMVRALGELAIPPLEPSSRTHVNSSVDAALSSPAGSFSLTGQ